MTRFNETHSAGRQTDKCIDLWMDGQLKGWMDKLINEYFIEKDRWMNNEYTN